MILYNKTNLIYAYRKRLIERSGERNMDNINKEIGKRIWELRNKNGYTREFLSEKANISARFLYEIETGKKGMSVQVLMRLASSLNTDCNTLISGEAETDKYAYIEGLLSGLSEENFRRAEWIIYHFCKACES